MLLLLVLVDVSIFMIRKSQSAKRKDDCGIKGGCRGAWRRAEFRFEIWREFVPHSFSEVRCHHPSTKPYLLWHCIPTSLVMTRCSVAIAHNNVWTWHEAAVEKKMMEKCNKVDDSSPHHTAISILVIWAIDMSHFYWRMSARNVCCSSMYWWITWQL